MRTTKNNGKESIDSVNAHNHEIVEIEFFFLFVFWFEYFPCLCVVPYSCNQNDIKLTPENCDGMHTHIFSETF